MTAHTALTPAGPDENELLARLRAIPADSRAVVIEWLQDCARDALEHDPSVGIYANPDMAEAFRILDQLVGSGEIGRPVLA